jgi:hypothetical protein
VPASPQLASVERLWPPELTPAPVAEFWCAVALVTIDVPDALERTPPLAAEF